MNVATGKSRSRRWLMTLCVSMIVAVGCLAGAAAVQQAQSESEQSSNSTTFASVKSNKVSALGRLEPAGTVLKLSPPSGNDGTRVEKMLVKEGDDVESGAVVAVLDNAARRQAALLEAQAQLGAAEARLAQVKAGAKQGDIAAQQLAVDVLAEQLRVADRELKRGVALHEKNALTIEALDAKQWSVDRTRLEHLRAIEQLNSVREVREIDIRVAERDVVVALAAVERTQADYDATSVRAPTAGRILKIHSHEGERISDQGLLEMGDVLHMEAVAEVFEADVARIQTGLAAVVKVDSFDEPLTGEVAEIGHRVARKVVLTNDPVSDTDARVVEVRVRLNPVDVERVVRLSNARVEVQIELPAE